MSFFHSSVVVMRGCVSTARVVAHAANPTAAAPASTGAITFRNGRRSIKVSMAWSPVPGTGYRTPDTGYRIPDAGYRVPLLPYFVTTNVTSCVAAMAPSEARQRST